LRLRPIKSVLKQYVIPKKKIDNSNGSNNNNNNNNNPIIIHFNSVLCYQCAASTARWPITDAAQENKKINTTK
jgi:hypothetical protein